MKLTEQHLLTDKQAFQSQIQQLQGVVNYIDHLIKFMQTPEPETSESKPEPKAKKKK